MSKDIEETIFEQAIENMYVEILESNGKERHIDFPEPIKFSDFPTLWVRRTGDSMGGMNLKAYKAYMFRVWEHISTLGQYQKGDACIIRPTKLYIKI